jgi:HK97 family phage major capsid protein
MATSQELREKRLNLVAQSRQILDKAESESRDLLSDEQSQFERYNADIDRLGKIIDASEKYDKLEREHAEVKNDAGGMRRKNPGSAVDDKVEDSDDEMPHNEARALAMQGWFLSQNKSGAGRKYITDKHRSAMRQCSDMFEERDCLRMSLPGTGEGSHAYDNIRSANRSRIAWDAAGQRFFNVNPLTSQQGGGGGVTVPEGFVNRFETALLAYGYMMQVAEVMRTPGANPMPWPTANDTSNKGRRLNQNAVIDNAAATTAYPTFGATVFYSYKYTSDEILVPFELLRDNAVGLEGWLGEALGTRIGRVINDDFTTGLGNNQPNGIMNAATSGKTSASATAIKYDELIDLEYSVDPAYRFSGQCGYMAHDGIIQYLRKLKTGDGVYLWQPSLLQGEPDRLNGYPVTRNQSMQSTVATATKTVLFGMLSKYKIRQVGDLRIYRLVERYRDNDQDAFLAFQEFDGNLLDAGTHPVKYLTQA